MNNKVAILGCGPAGLLAAHAANQAGWEVDIYSYKRKSEIHGAQILHVPIPGITSDSPDAIIDIHKLGDEAGYATKVYGRPDAPNSWQDYEAGPMPIWSMEQAYETLWEKLESRIVNAGVGPDLAGVLVQDYILVVSSIPLPVLAPEATYKWQDVWVYSVKAGGDQQIVWSGDPEHQWYRKSLLFGNLDYEFSEPPSEPSVMVRKPLSSSVPPDFMPGLLRVGRYGEFRKGVLVHDAYDRVIEHFGGN